MGSTSRDLHNKRAKHVRMTQLLFLVHSCRCFVPALTLKSMRRPNASGMDVQINSLDVPLSLVASSYIHTLSTMYLRSVSTMQLVD